MLPNFVPNIITFRFKKQISERYSVTPVASFLLQKALLLHAAIIEYEQNANPTRLRTARERFS